MQRLRRFSEIERVLHLGGTHRRGAIPVHENVEHLLDLQLAAKVLLLVVLGV